MTTESFNPDPQALCAGSSSPETSPSRDEVADLLRAHGVMPTHQRLEIAQVMFERKQHLSADQVLARVNAVDAETSKATVYNTLKLFVEKQLVRELIVDPCKVFYDSNVTDHHHFYDVASGRLTDIPADQIRLSGLPSLPAGTVAAGVDIIIRTRPQA
jgi:Fur family iron response transcriptional regulator